MYADMKLVTRTHTMQYEWKMTTSTDKSKKRWGKPMKTKQQIRQEVGKTNKTG